MDLLALWGKTGEGDHYHPLSCHLLDVASVIRSLWAEGLPLVEISGADALPRFDWLPAMHITAPASFAVIFPFPPNALPPGRHSEVVQA